jgi:hypothetical protein
LNEINATNTGAILRVLQRSKSPCLLVLRGYPRGLASSRQKPFAVRIYNSRNVDIAESVMDERPYWHFLGCYTGDVAEADLAEDIASMIAVKYRVAVNG